jgi:hypothetical protein
VTSLERFNAIADGRSGGSGILYMERYTSKREEKKVWQLNIILACLEYVNWYGDIPY